MRFLISFLLVASFNLFGQSLTAVLSPQNFNFTDQAVDSIKSLESYQDRMYYDNNNNRIFGYGHLVTNKDFDALKDGFGYETTAAGDGGKQFVPPTKTLSDAEKNQIIEDYLRKDLEVVLKRMKKNITVSLTQYKVDALVIYFFWRGASEKDPDVKELYDLINKGDDKAVADFITNRPKRDQRYLYGNQKRNTNTADLYLTGNYPYWN